MFRMAGSTAVRRLWKQVADVKVNGDIPLAVYRSQRSELRVAVAGVPGPMVKGLISFATETNSDDGLPHTLEHLVFMGSKKYPWKGVLDIIANRCLASGTNAWTDQDHTAYTLTTLGSSGFLKVLPVYMDHVLAPTLTDAQYATEVHHINGDGEDAGVVYSEMQNYESDMESLVSWTRKGMMYPPNNSYAVETGGRLENLRSSCSNEKVRAFHEQFYHLSNMMIVVCGPVDHDKLLAIIESSEERFLSKIPKEFRRPFSTDIPELKESQMKKIECPADESVTGVVEIAWFGPKAQELYEVSALSVLSDYLRDTAVSPLEKDFVQLEDPYCSHVNLSMDEQTKCTLVMEFSGVPVDKLELVKDRFFDKTLREHADASKFDMNRMEFLINQSILKCHTKMETDGHNQIFHTLIGHQLYGDRDRFEEDLRIRMNEVDTLKKLASEPASFWSNLMQKYMNKPHVCVIGDPSEELVTVLEQKEHQRLEAQKESLGADGLMNCKNKLDCANKANTENKPSADVLEELIVQDLEKFNVFDIRLEDNFGSSAPSLLKKIPVPTFLHDGPSKFIELHVVMDTSTIPFELRKYLMLWFEVMFESPARIDGKVLPYEEVSVLATKDLISQSVGLGIAGYFDRFMTLRVKVDAKELNNAAKWLDIWLKGVVFDEERLKVALNKLVKHADELRRDGSSVVNHLHSRTIHSDDSNAAAYSTLSLQKFHEKLLKEKNGSIVEKLTKLRDLVLSAPLNVHLVCDNEEVQRKNEATEDMWQFLGQGVQNGTTKPKKLECTAGEEIVWDRFSGGSQSVIGIGATESSFLKQSAEFPEGWNGDSTMETLLLAQYLSQCEGPLWRAVRGKGLAYGANIYVMPDKHLLTCSLYRCSQTVEAYEVTKNIVKEILSKKSFDESEFEAAKRSLICELFESRDTVKTAAKESIVGTLRNTSASFLSDFTKRIWAATPDQVFEKGGPHLEALFDDSKSVRSIVVHPSKLKELESHFAGIRVTSLKSLQI
uniref:Peptidase_M16_C domain-containing protein n=1 Tax=Steinernema glaseri TaxID=37863 RepID=A0A1I7ZZX7_9BILA